MIGRKGLKILVAIVLVTIALVVALVEYVRFSFKTSEMRAQAFCDQVIPREAISVAIAQATREKIAYSSRVQYQFYFPFNMGFDRAVCNVSVDEQGKVLSSQVEMEMD